MTLNVTPHLVQLTFEAALKSFWRKEALRKFLRDSRISEAHLATWSNEESKREFLDRTFGVMQRNDRGRGAIALMATSLADQTSFPDLRNWEDSVQKIKEATQAVAELKEEIKKQAEIKRSDEERKIAQEKGRREREEIIKKSTNLGTLMARLNDLAPHMGTAAGGYEFEKWFFDFLSFSEMEIRRPYSTNGRQIDGSVTVDGTTYLIELKFSAKPTPDTEIDIFRSKVESKADNTMGLFVSMAGYSSVAISGASGKKTTLLLLDASHVYFSLAGTMKFQEVVKRVRRHASQTAESYLPVGDFGG